MKLHSVLIVTEKPDAQEGERYKQWLAFSNGIANTIKKARKIEILAENVFLIALDYGMSTSTEILFRAQENRLKYKVLFFEKEPQWIRSVPIDPMNTGGIY
jgi:hypothetical protein